MSNKNVFFLLYTKRDSLLMPLIKDKLQNWKMSPWLCEWARQINNIPSPIRLFIRILNIHTVWLWACVSVAQINTLRVAIGCRQARQECATTFEDMRCNHGIPAGKKYVRIAKKKNVKQVFTSAAPNELFYLLSTWLNGSPASTKLNGNRSSSNET